MKLKFIAVTAVAFLLLGAFLAGGISLSLTSAKTTANPSVVQSSQPNTGLKPIVQSQPQTSATQPVPAQPQAAEPTEVAGTPEATEVVGANEPAEANEPAGQSEASKPNEPAGQSEAAEAASLQSQATITQQQAEATALAANPGTTVVKTQLGDENGTVLYSVELSNGNDVKVNAKTGTITATDSASTEQAGDSGQDSQNAGDQQGEH